MRTIIAGGRDFDDYAFVENSLATLERYGWTIHLVCSGAARGADYLGEEWARDNEVMLERFPADWDEQGKAAGFIRNQAMADYADALVAFWDGKSKGTKHMIDCAVKEGLYIKVFYYGKKTKST